MTRTSPRSIALTGLCWIDFDGDRFPMRAEVALTEDLLDLDRAIVELGNVEPGSGRPPRLPRTAMVLGDHSTGELLPQLVLGRRPIPLVWTLIVTVTASGGVELHEV